MRIVVRPADARYELLDGAPIELVHHGEPFTLTVEAPQVRPCPSPPARRSIAQPPGRAPTSKHLPEPGP
jgi:alpha,alpha-trehalose phosphorylase